MSEPDLIPILLERLGRGRLCAWAVILRAEGSTPREAGTWALIDADACIVGTLGGGQVEAEAQRRGARAIETREATIFDYSLEGETMSEGQPICGGSMRVAVFPVTPEFALELTALRVARDRGERGVLQLRFAGGPPPKVAVTFRAERTFAELGPHPEVDALRRLLDHETPEWLVEQAGDGGETTETLRLPILPATPLLIVGGGHVGQAVARQADGLGFQVTVVDDRPEFTRAALYPDGVLTRCGPILAELETYPWERRPHVVIVTRGHQHDAAVLEFCLPRPTAYIGMIGSRRKVTLVRDEFLATGRATAADWDRVYAPIGLDLGARTVPEIAVSIVAQLISVRRTGAAGRISLTRRT